MTDYLIWSNEHRGWWGPNSTGYTTLTHKAGRYSEEVVDAIVAQANCHLPGGSPNEIKCEAPPDGVVISEAVDFITWFQRLPTALPGVAPRFSITETAERIRAAATGKPGP